MELEAVLNEIEEQEQESVQKQFRVTDLETAAEASRRVAYFVEKQKEVDAVLEAQMAPYLAKIEKLKAWAEHQKQEYVDKQEFYSNQLEFFLRIEVDKQNADGKKAKKTISLPYGSISLKKRQPEFVKDEEQLFNFAKQTGFVRVKESTAWDELKKQCTVVDGKLISPDGEIVPGVVVVEREDKFELKLE